MTTNFKTKDIIISLLILVIWIPLLFFKTNLNISVETALLATLIGEATLLIPVYFLGIRKYKISWKSIGFKKFNPKYIFLGIGLWFLVLIFNIFYNLFLSYFGLKIQVDLAPLFEALSSNLSWALIIGASTAAPIFEEIYFRGFLIKILRAKNSKIVAAVLSSAIFAAAHLYPASFIPIFFLGMLFSYLYYKSGSIYPAIIIHGLNNFIALFSTYIAAGTV